MIIKEVLQTATQQLNNQLEAEILLAHILKSTRETILISNNKKITARQAASYFLLVKQRLAGQPIAYLTGRKEFYGLNFLVNKNVLIPRPETELMVEETINLIQNSPQPKTIIDVGTGGGCIIVTLVKKLKNLSTFCHSRENGNPGSTEKKLETKFIAIDISSEALKIAKKNAKLNGVEKLITFKRGNLLKPIQNLESLIHDSKFMILANLPYLTSTQIKNSPSIKCEPKLALTAGPDGLKYYRQLFKQIKKYKIINYTLFCEIDHTQTVKIKKLIRAELPNTKFKIKKDLSGYDRLVIIEN